MRLGILSDTHNQRDRTRAAVELLKQQGADVFFHCGDFIEASILELLAGTPTYFVFGNNDCDTISELRAAAQATGAICLEWSGIVTLGEKQIAITHGHRTSEVRRFLAQQPDYLLSGHSHVPTDQRVAHTRRINPGALSRAKSYTVALLDLATDELQFLDVPSVRGAGIRAANLSRRPLE